MRVALDARYGLVANRRGIGVATYHLLRAWRDMGTPDIELFAFADDRADTAVIQEFAKSPVTVVVLPGRPFVFWEQISLPRAARRYGADLIHALANVGPLTTPLPLVVSMHDVIEWHRGREFPAHLSLRHRLSRAYRMGAMAKHARAARAIHTVSHHAAEDIHQTLRVPREKIWVVPLGYALRPGPEDLSVLHESGLSPGAYAMAFGALDLRKNTKLLIDLWNTQTMPLDLVLVGLEQAALLYWRARLLPNGRVHLLGFESDSRVKALMQHASVFLYPSFYEGFGLPALEALSLGVPVILGRGTSAEEISQGAALGVAVIDIEAWRAGITRVVQDNILRRTLMTRGREVAKQYTWARTATRLLDLYRTVQ